MIFIGFPILSSPIQLHAATSIGYAKPYGKQPNQIYYPAVYRS